MTLVWILVGVVAAFLILGRLFKNLHSNDPAYFFKFLKSDPEKVSMLLIRNGEAVIDHRADEKRPLASTVKLILAIEYAQQVASGVIRPDQLVDLKELERYYIPSTDGGAHPEWMDELRETGQIDDGRVTLREVVRGMMAYSSNANTEYLLHLLGAQNVNDNLSRLGLHHHDPLYPSGSAILAPHYLIRTSQKQMTSKQIADQIKKMSREEYEQLAWKIHDELRQDSDGQFKSGFDLKLLDQRIWSDRLPAATAREYISILQKINNEQYFPPHVLAELRQVIEAVMENPVNREWLVHSGGKGGDTAYVLNQAVYAHDKENNRTELVVLMDDLLEIEKVLLSNCLNNVMLGVLKDEEYRNKLAKIGKMIQ